MIIPTCYNEFAPMLEVNQTVSTNTYKIMLDGFMLFEHLGPKK
jgi:hypothetical protein